MQGSLQNTQLQYKKLTKEEMESRGILGRLVGICADFIDPTRNGRKYGEELWEKVFSDPIMQEKIKNNVCYGELNHPFDERTEVDIEKAAICLAEVPKKGKDGKLRAVFDILSTPAGKILNTLCKYGSVLGISSRGTGDIIKDYAGNETVDPSTYVCEGFDIVTIPAVKSARLQYVTESLDTSKIKTLVEALDTTINEETDEEKQELMKQIVNSLELDKHNAEDGEDQEGEILTEKTEVEPQNTLADECYAVKAIKKDQSMTTTHFTSNKKEAEDEYYKEANECKDCCVQLIDIVTGQILNSSCELEDTTSVQNKVESEDTEADNFGSNILVELQESLKTNKSLSDQIKSLQEQLSVCYAKDSQLQTKINEQKDSIRVLSVNKKNNQVLKEQLEKSESNVSRLIEELNVKNEAIEKNRQTLQLYSDKIKNKSRSQNELKEQLETTKSRVSYVEGKYNKLYESALRLQDKNKELKETAKQLKESYDSKVKAMQEDFNKDIQIKESLHTKQLKESNEKAERYYKNVCIAVDKYISLQAERLGCTPQEIKSRLNEKCNFAQIDKVCEQMKQIKININKLPLDITPRTRISIEESRDDARRRSSYNGYSDSDTEVTAEHLMLAGLM